MEACPENNHEGESATVTVPIATIHKQLLKNNRMGKTSLKQPVFIFSGRWFFCVFGWLAF